MSFTTEPTLITADYRKTALARAVPYSIFQDGGWWLPPDPDPDSARVALRLFPSLSSNPDLMACARLSTVDHMPIDLASARWHDLYGADGRAPEDDPWQRVAATALDYRNVRDEHKPMVPHLFQRIDADRAILNLDAAKGAYFGWEMGLGKTFGACMVIDGWDANFVFIACPNNAKIDPWQHDLLQLCPWLKPIIIGNTAKARALALDEAHARMEAGEPTALICHYAAVRLIEEKHGSKTVSGWKRFGQWDLVIDDEAHLHKNRTTQFTAACRRLDTVGRLKLSGSVMSGKAEELFVNWQMMQPRRYRSQWRDWNDPYLEVFVDDYNQKQIVGPNIQRLQEFREVLGEVLTVRLAKDWLNVPEANELPRDDLAMHPEQLKVYRKIGEDFMAELPDGEFMYTTEGAPMRSALRQITAGVPHPDGDGGLISVKHDAAMHDIRSAGDSQCVYFAWHKRAVYELQRRCLAEDIPCCVVTGDLTNPARERNIDLFKRGGHRVLVATIATLSMAANLQNASVVGMIEESDDPVQNEQAIGRVVRQGQPAHATVLRYRVKDSVDDLSVMTNFVTKQELRRMILGAG